MHVDWGLSGGNGPTNSGMPDYDYLLSKGLNTQYEVDDILLLLFDNADVDLTARL